MPYLNTDDQMPEHPKVDPLSDGAFRLHVAGMHYCARHLTDGLVPAAKVDRLKPRFRARELDELVAAKLWHRSGEGCGTVDCPAGDPGAGYVVHDFLQWNKSAQWWSDRRAKTAKRVAKWRDEHGT